MGKSPKYAESLSSTRPPSQVNRPSQANPRLSCVPLAFLHSFNLSFRASCKHCYERNSQSCEFLFPLKRCRLSKRPQNRANGSNQAETKALYRTRPLLDAVQSPCPG